MIENRLIKETGLDKLFTIANYLFAGILLLLVLYPLVYVLSASFSSPESLMGGRFFGCFPWISDWPDIKLYSNTRASGSAIPTACFIP